MKTRNFAPLPLIAPLFLVACTHSMQVKNLDDYHSSPGDTLGRRHNVALLRRDPEDNQSPFVQHVVEALRNHPAVDRVRTGWRWEVSDAEFTPDVVLALDPQPEFHGSGWNFLITFPGFLLFSHAWNGYVYRCDVPTSYTIYNPQDRSAARSDTIATTFDIRHCDFERGFWASTGWWVPGYGGSSLLAAPFLIPYDPDATASFHDTIRTTYGRYIAESILRNVIDLERERKPNHVHSSVPPAKTASVP